MTHEKGKPGFFSYTPKDKPALLLLLAVFIDIFAVAIVIPLLPYYVKALGATPKEYGLIGTVYGAFQLIGAPIFGRLSDSMGRKKVFLFSLCVAGASYMCMPFAPTLFWLAVCRMPVGFGKQTISIAYAYISDVTEHHERAKWMGRIGVSAACAFIVGPALGGLLSDVSPVLPGLLAGMIYFADVVFVLLYLPESMPLGTKEDVAVEAEIVSETVSEIVSETVSDVDSNGESFLDSVRRSFASPMIGRWMIIYFLFQFGFLLMKTNMSVFNAERFAFGPAQNGLVLSYVGIVSLVAKVFVLSWTSETFGERSSVLWGLVAMAVSMAALAVSYDAWVYVAVLIPFIFSTSSVGPCMISMLTKSVARSETGTFLGVASAVESISRVLSPVVCGFLMTWWDGAPPLTGAVVALIGAVYTYSILHHLPDKPKQD